MKKTLIALAAVAAASASYAQVSLTGEAAWGFLSTTDANKTTLSGLGIDTAQLVFKAGEDLGGGSRVDIKLSLNTGAIGGTAGADDQSLTLTTSAGSLTLATYKPGDWVTGASGGATWYGLDGKVLSARQTRDAVAYSLPVSSALTLSAAYLEPGNSLGEGAGSDGTTGQSLYSVGAKYSAGAVVAQAAYLSYNSSNNTDLTASTVTRLGGTYDLGVAKVGLGLQSIKYGAGATNTQTALSASAPLSGGLSVNGTYASNSGSATATRTGYVAGLQYNLSKRTYAILNTASWTGSGDTNSSSLTALTLVHDF